MPAPVRLCIHSLSMPRLPGEAPAEGFPISPDLTQNSVRRTRGVTTWRMSSPRGLSSLRLRRRAGLAGGWIGAMVRLSRLTRFCWVWCLWRCRELGLFNQLQVETTPNTFQQTEFSAFFGNLRTTDCRRCSRILRRDHARSGCYSAGLVTE